MLEAEARAGRLPSLSRIAARGGATRAITAFPSTTSVSYLPFLTGCTPGTCNVPSIRWLDRSRYDGRWWASREAVRSYCGYQAGRLDGDIAPGIRTVFELVPESVGIFTMVTKGLRGHRDAGQGERKFWGAVAHYAEWHQPSDDAVARHLLEAALGPAPFVFAQFPAVDGYSHQRRPDAPRVLAAGEDAPRALRVANALASREFVNGFRQFHAAIHHPRRQRLRQQNAARLTERAALAIAHVRPVLQEHQAHARHRFVNRGHPLP